MVKAFVFGKFLPFHKGHEAMINFALTKCDFLSVLVCCSDTEKIPSLIRKEWIEKSLENNIRLEVRLFNYKESDLPNTSVSSAEVSKLWAKEFVVQFPDYSILVTSEDYGKFVAEYMNIKHIPFDLNRNIYPISATDIRNNLFEHWKFLPDSVKPYFVFKVVILGTESTGKTTMAEKLSQYYNCSLVMEAGRDIVSDSNSFNFSDLYLVADEHVNRINNTIIGNSPLVIIDTDIHITKSYSRFIFGKELSISSDIYDSNKANLYLYLNNDVEYIQDGTRLSEIDRDKLDISHRQILAENYIDFVEIDGNWEQRFNKAIKYINEIIYSHL